MPAAFVLIRWEWFKLQRRWMPWILLAVLVASTQILYWAMYALNAVGELFLDTLLLPNGVGLGLTFGNTVLVVAVVIWTASALGSEYSWGTFRAVLAKGTGRWQFLAAIFALMAAMGVAWLLVVCIGMGISGLLVGSIEGEGSIATSGEWSTMFVQVSKSALAFVPYIAVAMFFTVLTTSANTATAITLIYRFIVEGAIVPIVLATTDTFDGVAGFVLGRAVDAWLSHESDSGGQEGMLAFGGADALTGNIHGLAVMAVYTVALFAAAVWLFQRRDIGGAKGA